MVILTSIFAYGSRVTGKAQPASDLDLCIMEDVSFLVLGEIKEALNNLLIPFSIDVVVWGRLSKDFKAIISKDLTRYIPDPFLGAQIIDLGYPLQENTPVWPGGCFSVEVTNRSLLKP